MRQLFKYVCLGIMIALPLLFIGENQFSYANQETNFEQEIRNAIEAQKMMDESSKKQLVASMNLINSIPADLTKIDIESLILIVQRERTNLLNLQLEDLKMAVHARNDQIAKLNNLLNQLNKIRGMFFNSDEIDLKKFPDIDFEKLKKEYETILGGSLNTKVTKEFIDEAIARVKVLIDAESNTQQMEMQRLQELTNKRNEALDVMEDFRKKTSSSIIPNIR